ncbi:MAG: hypothetical protein DMG14_32055 [Acidobacteria bacterium]|nr:MAG: hypothetical protein DMG14_32055 [Acidobacteriota bacterium]
MQASVPVQSRQPRPMVTSSGAVLLSNYKPIIKKGAYGVPSVTASKNLAIFTEFGGSYRKLTIFHVTRIQQVNGYIARFSRYFPNRARLYGRIAPNQPDSSGPLFQNWLAI